MEDEQQTFGGFIMVKIQQVLFCLAIWFVVGTFLKGLDGWVVEYHQKVLQWKLTSLQYSDAGMVEPVTTPKAK